VALNFTVLWSEQHSYTYRSDPNMTYWLGSDAAHGYGFSVHADIGATFGIP
jgi:hypothetical protein